jgi:hypothetical protein
MPIADFNYDAWVDSLQIPAELKTQFKELGKDETAKKALAESVMMRADYSRSLNDLDKQRKEVTETQAALTELQRTQAETGSKTQAELDRFKASEAALRRQLFEATEKLRTEYNATGNADEVVKDLGLDKIAAPEVPKADAPPAFDASRFVSIETFDNVRSAALLWPAMLAKLQMDHAVLFNRKDDPAFDPVAFTMKANAEGKDPQIVYDEMFGAPARRKENEVAAITATVRADLEREFQARIDAQANAPAPYQSLDGQPDPFGEALRSITPKGDIAAPLTVAPYDQQAAIAEVRAARREAMTGQPA